MKIIITPAIALIAATSATAQIEIVNSEATGSQLNLAAAYTQNFDTLANTGTALTPWLNNTTLTGWHAYRTNSGDITHYTPNIGRFASFGGEGQTDRALGSDLNGIAADAISFGVCFKNSCSFEINSFNVSFDGEQWFKNDTSAGQNDSLVFSYQIFDANLGSFSVTDGWVFVDELAFTSPISGGSTGLLNGNLPANRIADISSTIEGVVLASGQELWLRWTATNQESVNDHGLGIDNLVISFGAIPEPATYGFLFGGLVAVSVIFRRRTRGHSR